MNRYLDYVKHSAQEDRDDYSAVEYSPNDLYHYGVLGMKWGVRKASPQGNLIDRIRRNKQLRKEGNARRKVNKARREGTEAAKRMDTAFEKMLQIEESFAQDIIKNKKYPKDLRATVTEAVQNGGWDEIEHLLYDNLKEGPYANPEYIQAWADYRDARDEITIGKRRR